MTLSVFRRLLTKVSIGHVVSRLQKFSRHKSKVRTKRSNKHICEMTQILYNNEGGTISGVSICFTLGTLHDNHLYSKHIQWIVNGQIELKKRGTRVTLTLWIKILFLKGWRQNEQILLHHRHSYAALLSI